MRLTVSGTIKKFLSKHRASNKKNIVLFSSPRSGSTWVMELFCAQPGFKMVPEPFNIRKTHISANSGFESWEQLLDPTQEQRQIEYLTGFQHGLDRDPRFKRPKLFSPTWHFRTERVVYKVLFAGEAHIRSTSDALNARPLVLLRHPIAVSLSRKQVPRLRALLESIHFQNDEAIQSFGSSVLKSDNVFEQSVLDWCLRSKLILPDENQYLFFYEDFLLKSEVTMNRIMKTYELEDKSLLVKYYFKPSGSTWMSSTSSKINLQNAEANRKWLVDKWKDKVSDEQIEFTQKCLELTAMDSIYSASATSPLIDIMS